MNEQDFGKGAFLSPIDKRDFSYKGFSAIPYDWSKSFDVGINLTIKNQGQSSSCGGQAGSYYDTVLKALNGNTDERSAKFIYSQIFVPGGGTYGRSICDLLVNKGCAKEALTPSYEANLPPSEAFMENKADITPQAYADASTAEALAYTSVPVNIDSIAQAVRDNNGAVILLRGENNGTWLSAYPKPATTGEWNHFLYIGKCKMENGIKYLGVLNSWGDTVGEKGWQWLSEGHIKWIMECRTLVFKSKFQFTQNLSFGMRNNDVLELQKRMVLEKCATYTPTGFFGIMTLTSVIQYQKAHNISATGFVGAFTRASLNA